MNFDVRSESCSTPWSSSAPARSGWPPPPTPPSAAWTSSSSRPAPDAGAAVGEWAHVRLFSSWSELVDPAARRLLDAAGTWAAPDDGAYPTGGEWRERLPPAARRAAGRHARRGGPLRQPASSASAAPAATCWSTPAARTTRSPCTSRAPPAVSACSASAVVDASGTWTRPNPLGADGYPALGEREHAERITYGIPDSRRPGRRRPVRRQARRRRRQGRLGPGRPRRPGQARQDGLRPPGSRGCCAARPSATRSAAGTTTSSSSAAGSARTPRPPPPAGW